DAAERAGGGGRANEGVGARGKARHPGLVAEDGPARAPRGRVDGEHGNPVSGSDQVRAELIDGCRFAHAGSAGDADAPCPATCGQELLQQVLRQLLVVRPGALDERDRPRQHGPVTAADAVDQPGQAQLCALRAAFHPLLPIRDANLAAMGTRGKSLGSIAARPTDATIVIKIHSVLMIEIGCGGPVALLECAAEKKKWGGVPWSYRRTRSMCCSPALRSSFTRSHGG